MSFIDTKKIAVTSRKPGWYGRQFDSPSMTFVHYEFDAGASVHRHAHDQEEVWHILEGCLLYTSPSPRDTERSRMPSSA